MSGPSIFHAPRCHRDKLRAAIYDMADTSAVRIHRDRFDAMCEVLAERDEDAACDRADTLRQHAKDNA